jgi:iron complex outermembrane receptor protein
MLCAGTAFAQTEAPAAGATQMSETDAGLADIVVTARKREESLQSTPIAISAFNAAAIESRGVNNLAQISQSTPSLTFNTSAAQSGNPSATSVFLRGVGQLDFTMFTDPGVGIYVDGVYVARSVGAALDFIDVERVEVLRGPQGTLFGRNTIGGAISVIAKRPSKEFGGSVTAITGSFNRATLQGVLNVPLSETLFAKVSGYGNFRKGYAKRESTGQRMANDDALAGRFQLLWEPSSTFNAQLIVDGTRKREKPSALVALDLAGFGFNINGVRNTTPQANPPSVFNQRIGGICATNPDSSRNCFGAAWVTGDPYRDNGTFGDHTDLNIFGTNLTMNLDLGGASLKSITAYREMSARYFRDTDHTPLTLFQLDFDDDHHQFSQELQLTGTAIDGRFKYLLGGYYFTEKGTEIYDNLNAVSFDGVANVRINNRSIAIFTENTFDITQTLHLTAGLRYTEETKKFSVFYPVTQDFNLAAPPALGALIVADSSQKRRKFTEWNPRVTLSADVTDQLMAYATYSEGFKSGGFNGRYTAPVAAPISFEPEYVDQYEAGIKFSSPNFRFNAAAFHNIYSDIQVNFRPNPAQVLTVIGNAAKGRIDGVEAEVTIVPIRNFRVDLGGSYLDAQYTSVDPGLIAAGINTSTPFALTPRYSFSASASYEVQLGNGGSVTPRVDYSYRSKVYNDNTKTELIAQKGYAIVNSSIAYVTADRGLRVALGVTNLFDKQYLLSGAFNGAAGVAEGTYARPREWYLSVKKEF